MAVPQHPLQDKGFLKALMEKMSKKDLVFLVMILFFTFLISVLMFNMGSTEKFIIIIGMFLLIGIYIFPYNKNQKE